LKSKMIGRTEIIKTKYLIIGNSASGIGAAEAIRDVDKDGALTIVSDEAYPAYSRPLISELLANERTTDRILFRQPDFYVQNNINLLLNRKVTRLDLKQNIAHSENGEQIGWEKLLLATGGKPIIPEIKNSKKTGVFTFLTLKDAREISNFIKSGQQAVVMGGGLIGISATEALTKRGVGVTIVEMKDRVLNTILDNEASLIVEETLRQSRIKLVTNHTVSSIVGDSTVESIILDNGEKIPCDLVVIAIGVLPRTELAFNTKIKVNRGIIVDRYMATAYPSVYACGDVAEAYDFIYETNRVISIWPNAYIGGRVAGYNMAGIKTENTGYTAMNSLNYFGLDIATAGMITNANNPDYEIISNHNNGNYKKLLLKNDYITGMAFIRDIEKAGMIFSLMRDHINVRSLKHELLTNNFGLVCLPRQIWQERLGTPTKSISK